MYCSSDVCSSDLHVVETEIDRAIGSDAAAHPCQGVAPAKPHAREEAEDREYGEHSGEPDVFLEQAVTRLAVALVKRPEKAVHHQIRRATCMARRGPCVEISLVAGKIKKTY